MVISAPSIIKGACYKDERGELKYNNQFNVLPVKRIYFISNSEAQPVRGWQGHKIEQRWFVSVGGSFEITVVSIDNWENTGSKPVFRQFVVSGETLDVLHVPAGYATAIRALQPNSTLMAMSDYLLGEIKDEYRFSLEG